MVLISDTTTKIHTNRERALAGDFNIHNSDWLHHSTSMFPMKRYRAPYRLQWINKTQCVRQPDCKSSKEDQRLTSQWVAKEFNFRKQICLLKVKEFVQCISLKRPFHSRPNNKNGVLGRTEGFFFWNLAKIHQSAIPSVIHNDNVVTDMIEKARISLCRKLCYAQNKWWSG